MTMTPAPLTTPYHEFMSAMPDDVQPDIELSGAMRTAVDGALGMGWKLDSLIADAQACYRRGGGTGAVITRFRSLATRPAVRSVKHDAPELPAGVRHGFRPHPQDELSCVCNLPRANARHRI